MLNLYLLKAVRRAERRFKAPFVNVFGSGQTRGWKGRIKGRDWYDIIWYIQKKIPLNVVYLESCMRQANNLGPDESLDRAKVLALFRKKINTIDWASAKADMRPFISDPERLDIWSNDYFLALSDHLLVEDKV